jgi:arginyl-tRNA synthetase
MHEISAEVQKVVKELFNEELDIELSRTDEQFGDYATNVALRLGKKVGKNPHEIAQTVAEKLQVNSLFEKVDVAGPGFINLTLTDEELQKLAGQELKKSLAGKTVVAEYSDPNPFKVLHAGHVYTTIVGDAIAKLLETAGASVHRVNFGGDVGRHVAITMRSIIKELGGEHPEKLNDVPQSERAQWLAAKYIEGTKEFETDDAVKQEVVALNKKIYQLHSDNDNSSPLAQIYWMCRKWSYEAFDAFYARLGTKLEKYYPESETAELGLQTVKAHLGTVFEESDGAVIFNGEKYGLHTRVFINSEGLPTYEAKDVGLILKKKEDYNFDISVIVTGNEQQQYMEVVLKALEQFLPDLAKATTYIPHGMVRLAGGVKMSSRKGNIIRAEEVLNITAEAVKESGREPNDTVVLGAIKYAFLKNRIGTDFDFDPKESVSLQGNSGPYLQYAHARACSILAKPSSNVESGISNLEKSERSLLRKIGEYGEVVEKAVADLMPHHICTYLYELAQVFNRFYEGNRVVGDDREALRIQLVRQYAQTLKAGLELLGIQAPEKM